MAGKITYRCPDCGEKFSWPGEQPAPDYCPHCAAFVGDDPDAPPAAPAILSARVKRTAETHRAIEAATEARIEAAAAMGGGDRSDYSALRSIPAAAAQAEANGVRVMANPAAGAILAAEAETRQGPYARAGAAAMGNLTRFHKRNASGMVSAGTIARHTRSSS